MRHPSVVETLPQIRSKKDVQDAIDYVYKCLDNKLAEAITFLKNNQDNLFKIAKILSQKFDICLRNPITIVPAVCPVAPRWIDKQTFLVPYYWSQNTILRVCAHEMTHFWYFAKLHQLFPDEKIDTESPGADWLISEIIVIEVVNSPEIIAITSETDEVFIPDGVVSSQQVEQIQQLFRDSFKSGLDRFRKKALEIIRK